MQDSIKERRQEKSREDQEVGAVIRLSREIAGNRIRFIDIGEHLREGDDLAFLSKVTAGVRIALEVRTTASERMLRKVATEPEENSGTTHDSRPFLLN